MVEKNAASNVVYICAGADHPALAHTELLVGDPLWISGHPPRDFAHGVKLDCSARVRYRGSLLRCTLASAAPGARLSDGGSIGPVSSAPASLRATFAEAEAVHAPAVAQAFVMYDGDVCLGSASIQSRGPSLFAQNLTRSRATNEPFACQPMSTDNVSCEFKS